MAERPNPATKQDTKQTHRGFARENLLSALVLACLAPLAGCLTGGGAGMAALSPSSEGIAALGNGLVGQADEVKLTSSGKVKALEAEYQALQYGPVGQPVPWSADGYEGSVVPTQLYRVGSQDCRGYAQTVLWKTSSTKRIGTACRNDKGLWEPLP